MAECPGGANRAYDDELERARRTAESTRENVLEEALRITSGDPEQAYGDALADARRFAQIASAVTGLDIEPGHFPLIMIAVKLSRASQGKWHRDSIVDIAGYARVAEKIQDALESTGEGDPR